MIETLKQLQENEKKVVGELEDRISLLEIASRPTPLSKSKIIISKDNTGAFFWDQVSPIPYEYQDGEQYDFPSETEFTNKSIFKYIQTSGADYIQHIDSNNLYVDHSLRSMFQSMNTLQNISGLKAWNVSNVREFIDTFYGCSTLSDISPLANWDVSRVTSYYTTFAYCSSLSDITPLANWDVSRVYQLYYTFCGCSTLSDISPLANWDVSRVCKFTGLFNSCSKLLYVKPLANWNVSNLDEAANMFAPAGGSYSLMATDYETLEPWGEKLTALAEENKKRSYFGIPENRTLPTWMRDE